MKVKDTSYDVRGTHKVNGEKLRCQPIPIEDLEAGAILPPFHDAVRHLLALVKHVVEFLRKRSARFAFLLASRVRQQRRPR